MQGKHERIRKGPGWNTDRLRKFAAIISQQKLSLEVILQEGTAALSQFPQNIEKQKLDYLFKKLRFFMKFFNA